MFVQVHDGILGNQIRRNFVVAGLKSKEKTTLRVYWSNYQKWVNYAKGNDFTDLPADRNEVGEFLLTCVENLSLQVIKQITAAINFFHRLLGYGGPCGKFLMDY